MSDERNGAGREIKRGERHIEIKRNRNREEERLIYSV